MQLILAADENWAIGRDGGLLCHLPGDLKYFRERTKGKAVLMGRKTLESLPGGKPLPDRDNYVLTGNEELDEELEALGAKPVHSLEAARQLMESKGDDAMIIGGAHVYEELLPYCDTCYITKIYRKFDGDKHFANLDEDENFQITWQSPEQEEKGIRYQFFKYERKKQR